VNPPAIAFADPRGGWPGTYDTAASDLGKTFINRHALFLTGGDIYGYDAARGIRRFLLERKLATAIGGGTMPAIMGTNIYDLEYADARGLDYTEMGYEACQEATSRPVSQGSVGAGTGATVGPFVRGMLGSKGGLGSRASRVGRWTVGTIVVTNCIGNVYDPFESETIAGTHRKGRNEFMELDSVLDAYITKSVPRFGTTIGVVGTDAPLNHEQLARLVELAHDGIALAVRPAHMSTDGDTLLGFATRRGRRGQVDYREFDAIHHTAVQAVARAAVNAANAAKIPGGVRGFKG